VDILAIRMGTSLSTFYAMRLYLWNKKSALLSSLLVTVLLAACGGGEPDSNPQAAQPETTHALETAAEVTPTSDGTWTKLADEGGLFALGTSRYVRFGTGTQWVGQYIQSTGVLCNSTTFGADPAPGVRKECDYYTAPATATGSALLTWNAPTGSVAGYRVYYGTSSKAYNQPKGSGLFVTNTTYTVPSLTNGKTWYFAVTAVDASGTESAYSTEATKVIP
jgi:hypothetical protein